MIEICGILIGVDWSYQKIIGVWAYVCSVEMNSGDNSIPDFLFFLVKEEFNKDPENPFRSLINETYY